MKRKVLRFIDRFGHDNKDPAVAQANDFLEGFDGQVHKIIPLVKRDEQGLCREVVYVDVEE